MDVNNSLKDYRNVQLAAQAVGVSPDTIRRWEKKGLVRAVRSDANHRLFDITELHRIKEKYLGTGSGRGFYVLQSPPNGMKVLELFSGAGGLALGLENAGFEAAMLVEWDKDAAATLQHNRPGWQVIHGDVAGVDYGGLEGTIDLVAGGFPCQSFSYAGQGMGFGDTRGTMFFEFARCVAQVRPKVALGENVRGLLEHDGGRTLATMVSAMEGLGYRVVVRLLRAQFHDVAQKRERLFILGIRDDIDTPHLFPKENDYTLSLREALEGCPPSDGSKYPERKRQILDLVPPGGYWRDLPDDLQREYMAGSYHLGGGKTGMARRLSWDEPSLTLTCSPAQKQTERCHPAETRPLTVREYARIQTFPDDWHFIGSVASQYKQIGNAVPVNLGYHVGRALTAILQRESMSREVFEMAEPGSAPAQLRLL